MGKKRLLVVGFGLFSLCVAVIVQSQGAQSALADGLSSRATGTPTLADPATRRQGVPTPATTRRLTPVLRNGAYRGTTGTSVLPADRRPVNADRVARGFSRRRTAESTESQEPTLATRPSVSETPRNLDTSSSASSILTRSPRAVHPPVSRSVTTPRRVLERTTLPSNAAASRNGKSVLLMTQKSPAIEIESRGPRTIVVGKEETFEVHVRNTDDANANNVVVHIDVPRWAEVVSHNTSIGVARLDLGGRDNGQISWRLDQLAGQQRAKLTLKVIAKEAKPLAMGVTWSFTPLLTKMNIGVLEPKLTMSISGPQEVLFGETKVYKITLNNPGTGDAENVVVSLLPIIAGDMAVESKVGTVPAGHQKEIEIELTARQAGHLDIRVKAVADGGLNAEGVEQVLVRRAKLQIVAQGPRMKYAGTTATYQVRVSNRGNAVAENVQVDITLPNQAKFVTASMGGKLNKQQQKVVWSVGSLLPGKESLLEVRCVLASAGVNQLQIDSRADGKVTASETAITQVKAIADLKLFVDDPQGPVAVGEDVVYTIRIINRGTKAAENIDMMVFFSNGIEPKSVQGGSSRIKPGQVAFGTLPRVGAGEELTFKITAAATQAGNHVCRTEVVCRNPKTRLANEETTLFYGQVEESIATRPANRPIITNTPTPASPAPLSNGFPRR